MKTSALIFLCAWCAGVHAQNLHVGFSDMAVVFGDRVNVRKEPSAQAQVTHQLTMGDEVEVLNMSDSENYHTVNGLSLPWMQVKTAQGQTGYIWAGALSMMPSISTDGTSFVAQVVQAKQLTANEEDGRLDIVFEMRAIQKNKMVYSDTMHLSVSYGAYFSYEDSFEGALGLPGEKMLSVFRVGYPACGYDQQNLYMLWDGRKLTKLPLLTFFGDSGMISYDEQYLFPQHPEEYPLPDVSSFLETNEGIYLMITHMEMEVFEDGSGLKERKETTCLKMIKTDSGWAKPDVPAFEIRD
jgi:hypothetical protein